VNRCIQPHFSQLHGVDTFTQNHYPQATFIQHFGGVDTFMQNNSPPPPQPSTSTTGWTLLCKTIFPRPPSTSTMGWTLLRKTISSGRLQPAPWGGHFNGSPRATFSQHKRVDTFYAKQFSPGYLALKNPGRSSGEAGPARTSERPVWVSGACRPGPDIGNISGCEGRGALAGPARTSENARYPPSTIRMRGHKA
jgi:hypothetical protein